MFIAASAWKNSVNPNIGKVGMFFSPYALKSLNSIVIIQSRMMVTTFNSDPSATIISCSRATNTSDETDLITFYSKLSSLVSSIPKHNVLIIGGDINAQIGKNKNNKYCIHNSSNRNGEHLTGFSLENRLIFLNSKSQKSGELWTHTYATNAKAQIDYMLINKKWINSALNCEAYSYFEGISFDHKIVTAKIRLSLSWNTTQTAKTKHYDWSSLNNRDISNKYTITVRNEFKALQEISETLPPNDKYENFFHTHIKAATECIRTKESNTEFHGRY